MPFLNEIGLFDKQNTLRRSLSAPNLKNFEHQQQETPAKLNSDFGQFKKLIGKLTLVDNRLNANETAVTSPRKRHLNDTANSSREFEILEFSHNNNERPSNEETKAPHSVSLQINKELTSRLKDKDAVIEDYSKCLAKIYTDFKVKLSLLKSCE